AFFSRRRCCRIEVQETRLITRVHLDLQRIVVSPGDVQARGNAKTSTGSINSALLAIWWWSWSRTARCAEATGPTGAGGRRIRRHPLDPILGNDGDPVARQFHGRSSFCRLRRRRTARTATLSSAPSAASTLGKQRTGTHEHERH